MIDEAEFGRIADRLIADIADKIEEADADAVLECEVISGVLTIENETGKSWVVSKHAPNKQIWLASPYSGGLHFCFNDGAWMLADGRILQALLAEEIKTHAGVEVVL